MGSNMFLTPLEKAACQDRQTVHPCALQGSGWGGWKMWARNMCAYLRMMKKNVIIVIIFMKEQTFLILCQMGQIPDTNIENL